MTDTSPPPTVSLDPAGALAVDVTCRACGYNLRGLQLTGRCPECGLDVRCSADIPLLHGARPEWLRAVRCGLGLLRWGLALTLAAPLLHIGGCLLGPALMPTDFSLAEAVFVGLCLATLPAPVLIVCGAWLVTQREHAVGHIPRYRRPVSMVRLALIAVVLLPPITASVAMLTASRGARDPAMMILSLGAALTVIAAAAGWVALCRRLGDLAERLPRPKLANLAVQAGGAALILLLLGMLMLAISASLVVVGDLPEPLHSDLVNGAVPCFGAIALVVTLAIMAVSFFLVRGLSRTLHPADQPRAEAPAEPPTAPGEPEGPA
jgi:hypothetical protein